MDEVAELDVEVEGARLLVAEELVLEGAPDGTGRGGAVNHRLGEVGGDRAGDPGLDDAIHARSARELKRREIGKDVGLQRVLADDEEDLISPAGVVAGVQIEDDMDEAPNVLYADGLSVQVDDGGGFMSQDGVVKIGAVVDGVAVVVIVGLLVTAVGVGITFRSGGSALAGCPGVGVACARSGGIALMRDGGRLLLCGLCPSECGIALGLEGLGAFLALGGGGGLRGGWGVPVMMTGGAARGATRGLGMARGAA